MRADSMSIKVTVTTIISITAPRSHYVSPEICRSSVDLPDPDAPISPTISPDRMSSDTSSSALRELNVLCNW